MNENMEHVSQLYTYIQHNQDSCSYDACQEVVKNGRDLRDGKVIEAG